MGDRKEEQDFQRVPVSRRISALQTLASGSGAEICIKQVLALALQHVGLGVSKSNGKERDIHVHPSREIHQMTQARCRGERSCSGSSACPNLTCHYYFL